VNRARSSIPSSTTSRKHVPVIRSQSSVAGSASTPTPLLDVSAESPGESRAMEDTVRASVSKFITDKTPAPMSRSGNLSLEAELDLKISQQQWRRKTNTEYEDLMKAIRRAKATVKEHCKYTISLLEVADLYMDWEDMTFKERNQWLVDQLRQPGLVVNTVSMKRRQHAFRVVSTDGTDDARVCRKCWALLNGDISANGMKRAFANVRAGVLKTDTGGSRVDRGLNGTMSTGAWFTGFGKRLGDLMPDCDVVQLPCKDQTEVWNVYKDAMAKCPWEKPLGLRAFTRVMKNLSQKYHARVRKAFLQCTMCHYLDAKIARNVRKQSAAVFKKLKDIHRAHVGGQKAKYYKHRDKGKHPHNNSNYLSVIVDGMDQSKTQCPRMARTPKSLDGREQLKFHVTGVIMHGHMHVLYTWVDNFPKDPNVTCSVLMEAFKDLRKLHGPDWKMPKVLLLQLDNCSGENKNQCVMLFLCALVYFGVFARIKLSFLLVGHTHEDIDQLFSRLSIKWGPQDIWSLPQLVYFAMQVFYGQTTRAEQREARLDGEKLDEAEKEHLLKGYSVTHKHLTTMADVKTWLGPLMKEEWFGLTSFRCMKFRKDDNGDVRIFLRTCMCSADSTLCEEFPNNTWEPRDINCGSDRNDGQVLIFDAENQLDPRHIPLVPMKKLPATEEGIMDFFDNVPSELLKTKAGIIKKGLNKNGSKKRAPAAGHCNALYAKQQVPVDEEGDTSSSGSSSESDDSSSAMGQAAKRPMHEGRAWFKTFFAAQRKSIGEMCAVCKELRATEAGAKDAQTALEKTHLMKKSMEAFKAAVAEVSRNEETSSEEDTSDDAGDGEAKDNKDTPLKRARAALRVASKELATHMADTDYRDEHGKYETDGLFGEHEANVDVEEADWEDMDDSSETEAEKALAALPLFITQDQEAPKFRVGGKSSVRKVHENGGCLAGHHVIVRHEDTEAVFFVGDVIGRSPSDPVNCVEIHLRGNVDTKLLGTYKLAWVGQDDTPYFSEKKKHPSHVAWTESNVWISGIITWSSDWVLLKGFKLPAKALSRVKFTTGIEWNGKELEKKSSSAPERVLAKQKKKTQKKKQKQPRK
jgi:hypothetical protein